MIVSVEVPPNTEAGTLMEVAVPKRVPAAAAEAEGDSPHGGDEGVTKEQKQTGVDGVDGVGAVGTGADVKDSNGVILISPSQIRLPALYQVFFTTPGRLA